MAIHVSSAAFSSNGAIPRKYTCDGGNAIPPIEWTGVPEQSRSLAVICEDPDAPSGTFTHWVLYDLPPSTRAVKEGTAIGKEGVNDFGKRGFGGPCPPQRDGAHHYHVRVFALDLESLGGAGLSRDAVMDAMRGHVLSSGDLVGTYRRAAA